jgi:hypothetical protein
MSISMRIFAGAAALAALVLSATAASACCGGCGCGYGYGYATYYQPMTVYAPVQPTYAVDQGPVYEEPAAVATEPVSEEYGYGGGYRGGWHHRHRHGWGHRHGWLHRAGYHRVGGWGRGWGRYPLRSRY